MHYLAPTIPVDVERQHEDTQGTPSEKWVVWLFARDLLLTKQIDITGTVNGWKTLFPDTTQCATDTVRNYSEQPWQINSGRKLFC